MLINQCENDNVLIEYRQRPAVLSLMKSQMGKPNDTVGTQFFLQYEIKIHCRKMCVAKKMKYSSSLLVLGAISLRQIVLSVVHRRHPSAPLKYITYIVSK